MLNGVLRPLVVLFVLLMLVTGVIYPLAVTGIGELAFPRQVAGSLILRNGKTIGSALIAQPFQQPRYFWGRLSATAPMPNNALASGGSNYGPSNPALVAAAKDRIAALKASDVDNNAAIPIDLVTASASGLDPHISPAAALYQVNRVAAARHVNPEELRKQVLARIEGPQWGTFGEARINVLELNLALDGAR